MSEMSNKAFPFSCFGETCSTEQEAWDSFYRQAETLFIWLQGSKVWRTPPELFSERDFPADCDVFQVRARVVAFKELPDGMHEATIKGPYHDMGLIEEKVSTVGAI